MNRISVLVRRRVIRALVDRVDITFPEDWSPGFTVRDVVRSWLIEEAQR
ncbi:MAG: hypothetical protein RLZ55_1793 [Actinomycetota bacterium]